MHLYVSDLDGTLLNSDKEISNFSKDKLNRLINKGLQFTVATARTPATAVDILKGINITLPVAMMNGVLIYDINENKYIDIKKIKDSSVIKVLDIFKEHKKNCFVYAIKDNHLWVYHKDFTCSMEENFYDERCNKPLKTFIKVADYYKASEGSEIINFIIFDKLEIVKPIYDKLKIIEGITVDYYRDIYGDGYFLEAYSSEASKANAINLLSNYVDSDRLITFGDNVNDIPMFKISDECYATENATESLKKIATAVISSNNDDGVAKFILEKNKRFFK